jgi:hypothetical protein
MKVVGFMKLYVAIHETQLQTSCKPVIKEDEDQVYTVVNISKNQNTKVNCHPVCNGPSLMLPFV